MRKIEKGGEGGEGGDLTTEGLLIVAVFVDLHLRISIEETG